MDKNKLPKFEDNPTPGIKETSDFVANALVEVRSKPSPLSTEGKASPVDEPRFARGLIDLYLGESRANALRDQILPMAFGRAFQLGLRAAQDKEQS